MALLTLFGCEQCGFVRQELASAELDFCPDCGGPREEVTLAVAQDLLRKKLAAQRSSRSGQSRSSRAAASRLRR